MTVTMSLRFGSVLLLVAGACTAELPPPVASTTPTAAARLLASFEPTPCRGAARPIDARLGSVIADAARAPGRTLFLAPNALRLLERGQVRELVTPHPMVERTARLTKDGRVVAQLRGPGPGEGYLWESASAGGRRLVRLPTEAGSNDLVSWSPGMTRAFWAVGSFGSLRTFWVVDLDGTIHRLESSVAEPLYVSAWRSDEELTLVSARPETSTTQSWPIMNATLWSWRPPAAPEQMAGPINLVTWPEWSPDGHALATIESNGGDRSLVLRQGTTAKIVLSEEGLSREPNDCVRDVTLMNLDWSPDSRRVAVLGRGVGDFAAFVDAEAGGVTAVFTSPVSRYSCYIPGEIAWSGPLAVVPLHGPNCGVRAPGPSNAIALVDPKTGSLLRYELIGRKGFVGVSGAWAIAGREGDATGFIDFIDLSGNNVRVSVPLMGYGGHCCAD